MEAKKILEGISARMTKAQMMDEVRRADAQLELMDITQVAARLGIDNPHNVRLRAINHGIGTKVGKVGRVYTPADVETLRAIIAGDSGPREKTVKLKAAMLALRVEGLNNKQVAERLNVHPSYVTKLLK